MSLVVLRCPSCGATVQLSLGKNEGFCEYCGNPVRRQRTEAESFSDSRDREYTTIVNAAVAYIRHGEYKMAIEFADKAAAIRPGLPAPDMIRGVAHLPKDFKKARSSLEIGKALWSDNGSVVMTDELYDELITSFVLNYLDEKDKDLKRMIETIRGTEASDIENVRSFECRRKLDDYYTIPDLKDVFIRVSVECMDKMENDFRFSGQMTADNWAMINRFIKEGLYRTVSVVFVNPELKGRSMKLVGDFYSNLDMKWSSAFKNGVNGSKDELKLYSKYSEPVMKWLRSLS